MSQNTKIDMIQAWLSRYHKAILLAFMSILILLSIISIFINRLNHDVAYYLCTAENILDGAEVCRDLIDSNPPLIHYITIPPVLLARWTGLSSITLFRIYMIGLILTSVALSYILVNKIFSSLSFPVRFFFLFSIVYITLFFPGYKFSQREHMLVIFTLPYLFASIGRTKKYHFDWRFMMAIGFLASLGFSIKPHFLLAFITIEAYLLFLKRVRPFWLRPEGLTIVTLVGIYALSIFVFMPEYLETVKIAFKVYGAYNAPLKLLFGRLLNFLPFFPLLLFLFIRFNRKAAEMSQLLFMATIAMSAVYLLQQKGWEYHFLPAKSYSFLLLISILLPMLEQKGVTRKIFRVNPEIIIFVSIFCFLLFSARDVIKVSFDVHKPDRYSRLITNCRPYAEEKYIIFLSSSITPAFPVVTYIRAYWASPYSCLWILPGLYSPDNVKNREKLYRSRDEMDEIEKEMIDKIIDNMERYRPVLVVFNNNPLKQAFKIPFDFYEYFMRDSRFANLMSHYKYLETVDNHAIYLLQQD